MLMKSSKHRPPSEHKKTPFYAINTHSFDFINSRILTWTLKYSSLVYMKRGGGRRKRRGGFSEGKTTRQDIKARGCTQTAKLLGEVGGLPCYWMEQACRLPPAGRKVSCARASVFQPISTSFTSLQKVRKSV